MKASRRSREIDLYDSVDEIMRQAPQTIGVFLAFRMNCVGCPIGAFHSIEDSCREHSVDIDAFAAALRAAVT